MGLLKELNQKKSFLKQEVKSLQRDIQVLRKTRKNEEALLELQRNKAGHISEELQSLATAKKDFEGYKRKIGQDFFQKNKDIMIREKAIKMEMDRLQKKQDETAESSKQLSDRITAFENLKGKK